MFAYEKFKAYQHALNFVSLSQEIINQLPAGNSHLIDQLKRASSSIVLNIAEGTGKPSKKDRKRFYAIARGSAMECAAIIDIFERMQMAPKTMLNQGRRLLDEVTAILTTICFGKG